jgi:tetratricopeptide (TPR) repeat protein
MLVDEGVLRQVNGGWESDGDLSRISVPPTVSALVAARLERLEPSERDLVGRASVVGKVFQTSAVTELSPPERREDLGTRLMTLVRKELVRPDRSGTTGDEAFRFRHILVRDAAYGSLPKEQRADLHARFAAWLERIAGERLLEYEEVIAYHLEQAYRYRAELGSTDELTRSIGANAAERLRAAGLRALRRHDPPAATNLLSRAVALLPDDRERAEILMHLAGSAFEEGEFRRATGLNDEVQAAAERVGDELLGLRAELAAVQWELLTSPAVDEGRVLALADRLEARAIKADDNQGRVAAELARAEIYLVHCRWLDNQAAIELARSLLDSGQDPQWFRCNVMICNSLRYGPVPAGEAIERIETADWSDDPRDVGRLAFTAPLLAMLGRVDEARARARAGRDYVEERGLRMRVGDFALIGGNVEDLAGDLDAADHAYAEGIGILEPMGETGVLSTLAAMRSVVLYRMGRREEAEASIKQARETGAPNDISTQVYWRVAAAQLTADDGRRAEAEGIIREAVALVEPTDFLELRGAAFEGLAHVEARAGRPDGWKAGLERALAEHDRKGNLVAARRVREAMAQGAPPPTPTV